MGMTDPRKATAIDEELQAQFAAFGARVEIDQEAEPDVTEVWDTNWPALKAFLACETQWRVIARGMGGVLKRLGLDYAAVDAVLRQPGFRHGENVFADLREMELAALEAFDEAEAQAG